MPHLRKWYSYCIVSARSIGLAYLGKPQAGLSDMISDSSWTSTFTPVTILDYYFWLDIIIKTIFEFIK